VISLLANDSTLTMPGQACNPRLWGPLLITLSVFTCPGVAVPPSPQIQKTTQKSLALPVACQNLRKSNQRIADLLTTLASRVTAESYNALGTLFAQLGKPDCAVPAFEEALHLDNTDWHARYNLALALIDLKRYTAASVYLQDALKATPPPDLEVSLECALAVAYAESDRANLAIETLERAIKSHPDAADAYFNLI